MKIRCLECDAPLAARNMNAEADVAVCPKCDEAFVLSELVADQRAAIDALDLGLPPRGVSFERRGAGWRLTSTMRSPESLFFVPFAIFWCGMGLPALYAYVASGEYDWNQTIGVSMFCLATPVVIYLALSTTIGRVAVTVARGEGNVVVGVGPIRWTRRFDWNSIRKVDQQRASHVDARTVVVLIAQDRLCQQRVRFGAMLTDKRRNFMAQTLHKLLTVRETSMRSPRRSRAARRKRLH